VHRRLPAREDFAAAQGIHHSVTTRFPHFSGAF
jgi:hypothetical protein